MLFRAFFAFPFQIPPVQSLNLRDDHGLRRRACRITCLQPVRDLFEVLESHSDVEPVENRRFQDASTGEYAPESWTTIGEGRQHGVPGSTNRRRDSGSFALVLGPGVGRGVDFEVGGSLGRGSLRGHHGDQQA